MDEKAQVGSGRRVGLPAFVLLGLGVLVLVTWVVQQGMWLGESELRAIRWIQVVAAVGFGGDLLWVGWREGWRRVGRERWPEVVLWCLLFASLGMLWGVELGQGAGPNLLGKLGAGILQSFVCLQGLLQLWRAQEGLLSRSVRPEILFVGSFALLIGLATLLLKLPKAAADAARPIGWIDALFTATSAACVTGLGVRDTGLDFSRLGQGVILGVIQIGGLGIITFVALGSVFARKQLSVPQMVALREILSVRDFSDVKRQVLALVFSMLLVEVIGALFFWAVLPETVGAQHGLVFWSIFHAISAFCNAGFALQSNSLESYTGAFAMQFGMMALIVLGGLGISVYRDASNVAAERLRHLFRGRTRAAPVQGVRARWSVQSRLSLWISLGLLLAGALIFGWLEWRNSLAGLPLGERLCASAFQSVVPRTAGFNSVPLGNVSDATLVLLIALMAIGASPVSTGGGIKTVTFGVLLLTLRVMITGRERVEVFGRTLTRRALHAAVGVFLTYALTVFVVTFALCISDPAPKFSAKVFEVVSALSTVGLSTGITAGLSDVGKLILCAAMLAGRVGPLTFVLFMFRSRRSLAEYQYPEEELVVG